MTRFLLSLNKAVDTVFAALRDAKPGETFVPRVPSASMLNVARALIGTRPLELRTTGIRPGEKMHEVLISEEEARRCATRGAYYAVAPMLPELADANADAAHGEGLLKEYSSGDDVMGFEETRRMLEEHGLLIEQGPFREDGELLR
jgi:FlaA1/EpsC-like NDP-sugar epimerase